MSLNSRVAVDLVRHEGDRVEVRAEALIVPPAALLAQFFERHACDHHGFGRAHGRGARPLAQRHVAPPGRELREAAVVTPFA